MNTKSLLIAAVATASAWAASPAWADETTCRGTVGPISLDNVYVPDGASCTLDRTRLKGSVVVGNGASLYARSASIIGNVQAEGAAAVELTGASIVGGSVQLVQGGSAKVEGARINGDLQFESNNGALRAARNTIGGSLQAFQNLGGASFENNTMKGNLQCKENTPAPTGSGNRAASKEDQCARL